MHNCNPNRIRAYDYYQDNLYFVTSCVQHRDRGFGKIVSPKMFLNEYGKIAEKQWHWVVEQYLYIRLHELVIMPNHIHHSIKINRSVTGKGYIPPDKKIKSLSELMGGYKTTTSKQIHLTGYKSFAWQRSFYDHIIRDKKSFNNISNYIFANPIKWKSDTF